MQRLNIAAERYVTVHEDVLEQLTATGAVIVNPETGAWDLNSAHAFTAGEVRLLIDRTKSPVDPGATALVEAQVKADDLEKALAAQHAQIAKLERGK